MKRRDADTIQGLILKALRGAGAAGLRTVDVGEAIKSAPTGTTKHLRILEASDLVYRDGDGLWHLSALKRTPAKTTNEEAGEPMPRNEWLQREIDGVDAQIRALAVKRDHWSELLTRGAGK